MPTRSHRRSRHAPPGRRTRPTRLAGLPDPQGQADAKRPTPNPFEHAEPAYAGTSPPSHLVTMNCFDNSHDHRGRGCPTSTPPTNLPAQVRRATYAAAPSEVGANSNTIVTMMFAGSKPGGQVTLQGSTGADYSPVRAVINVG